MKKCVNGIVVEMTTEEIEDFQSMIRSDEYEEIKRKQAEYEASLITDDFGNKYEQVVVDGKLTLRIVEFADGTLNL